MKVEPLAVRLATPDIVRPETEFEVLSRQIGLQTQNARGGQKAPVTPALGRDVGISQANLLQEYLLPPQATVRNVANAHNVADAHNFSSAELQDIRRLCERISTLSMASAELLKDLASRPGVLPQMHVHQAASVASDGTPGYWWSDVGSRHNFKL